MKIMPLIALLCTGSWLHAQQTVVNRIIKNNSYKQPAYTVAHPITEQSLSIPCEFGKPELSIPSNAIDLSTVQVTAVDLVFTDYPSNNDLLKLNSNRLLNLFKQYPTLPANRSIEWKLVRQTDGAEREKALNLFHGFVIYYRPLQTKTVMEADIKKLKEMLEPVMPDDIAKRRRGFVTGDTTELRKNYEIEEYVSVKKMPVKDALIYLGIDEREKITYKKYDSLFVHEKPLSDSTGLDTKMKLPEDSTVVKVLDRMQWSNMLVVADVTASMYPYVGQLMLWLKYHEDERRIHQFVFFNDGDNRDEDTKIAGRTGGIYSTGSSVLEIVEEVVFKTMTNGSGGSIPENNIEALLIGLKACADCGPVVMIADNSSAVSDMSLLKQVNKPVHIILCGVHEGINTDYLDIARSTGGSVHLIDEDILKLIEIKEGSTISILGHQYKIVNGKFVAEK